MADIENETAGQEQRRNGENTPEDVKSNLAIEPEAEVVYRRSGADQLQPTDRLSRARERTREIAPAVTPLIIGFTLLLGLISILGFLSVRRMETVSLNVADLERTHAARLGLLLKLRLAVTKLNNEARARGEAESRGELKPPFDFRLGTARDDLKRLLRDLERPPLSESEAWRRFRGDLQSYIEVTEDLRRYSLDGFAKFAIVDREIDELLAFSSAEQQQIIRQSEALEQGAARSIRFWSVIALLVGALVAAGTIWEIQRRFRQMRSSMFEARRERAFTNQLLEGMVSAVAAIDENDHIRSANAAFFQIFPGASIGASVHEKFAPDDATKMLEAATATRVEEAAYRGRWVCRVGSDGLEKTLDVYSSPLAIDGDRGQILTLVDATEAAEAERGLRITESLAAVGRATTQVAHEIRNPLGSIRLGVSMLRDSVNDDDALRTIELVEHGIKHLNKLVLDVTQFSRQKALERADVDIHELLETSLDLVADAISEKKAVIERHFTDARLVGHWDADQLRQVFVNIVANAIDASPKGATVTISTAEIMAEQEDGAISRRYAQISIADQGKGIESAALGRIFEPFFSTKKRGTGLGLAIVKQIIEQHGGTITASSEPGNGARFVINLPV